MHQLPPILRGLCAQLPLSCLRVHLALALRLEHLVLLLAAGSAADGCRLRLVPQVHRVLVLVCVHCY